MRRLDCLLAVRIDRALARQLKSLSSAAGESEAVLVRQALRQLVAAQQSTHTAASRG